MAQTNTSADINSDPRLRHQGHESQHASMMLILIFSAIFIQVAVLYARKYHPKTFHFISFIGLWLIPFGICLSATVRGGRDNPAADYTRFLLIWSGFTLGQAVLITKKILGEQPMQPTTPRLIYRWFQRIYQLCYAIGIVGYVSLIADFFGLWVLLPAPAGAEDPTKPNIIQHGDHTHTRIEHLRNPWLFETGVILMFYGVYFGLLARDLIEILSERMAVSIGFYTPEGLPNRHLRGNICALCGDPVNTASTTAPSSPTSPNGYYQDVLSPAEQTSLALLIPATRLPCTHHFHLPCLKGWLLIGKKSTCPYCKEKVDTTKWLGSNPWDTQQKVYLALLDWVRWFLIWQPVVLFTARVMFDVFGLD